PSTKALQEQKELSLSPEVEWFLSLLIEGVLPRAKEPNPRRALIDDLLFDLREFSPNLKYWNKNRLSRFLNKRGCKSYRRKGGGTEYEFPALTNTRQKWDEAANMKTDWNEAEDWSDGF